MSLERFGLVDKKPVIEKEHEPVKIEIHRHQGLWSREKVEFPKLPEGEGFRYWILSLDETNSLEKEYRILANMECQMPGDSMGSCFGTGVEIELDDVTRWLDDVLASKVKEVSEPYLRFEKELWSVQFESYGSPQKSSRFFRQIPVQNIRLLVGTRAGKYLEEKGVNFQKYFDLMDSLTEKTPDELYMSRIYEIGLLLEQAKALLDEGKTVRSNIVKGLKQLRSLTNDQCLVKSVPEGFDGLFKRIGEIVVLLYQMNDRLWNIGYCNIQYSRSIIYFDHLTDFHSYGG